VSLYVYTLHKHYGALSTIPALLESMALKGAVLDGVWRPSTRSALGGWHGGWWPRKGPYCVRQISRDRSDSNRLGLAGSERVDGRALRRVAGALRWASCVWCLRVESGRC
jgi:hypothetical protein